MNDKLLELKRKRLQQQVLYLRTELEETEWIFQECLKNFDVEFRQYFKEPNKKIKVMYPNLLNTTSPRQMSIRFLKK